MKGLFIFVLGIVIGGYAMRTYDQREGGPAAALAPADGSLRGRARAAADQVRETAGEVRDDIADKLERWHLTSGDVKGDLSRTGQVVRDKARDAGAKIADARIVAVIKAKYVLDRGLSAPEIHVEVRDGNVSLSGTAASLDLIGRAVALALDTDGVRRVASHLTVK